MAATPRHVIFGTGAIGLATLDALRRRGERVRLVNRSGTYTYIPDIGEGLAVLGEHPDAPGEVWHLPNDPTPTPPASWSTPSTASPASPAPSSAAPRCWCCEPWDRQPHRPGTG